MAGSVDVFWSFRSPYSYLVTPDLIKLREDYDVSVVFRPVLPIAVRAKSALFDASDRKRPMYIVMDSMRRAEFLGMPISWPSPDPVEQDFETFKVAEDQSRIWRVTRLGVEAERRGKGIDFARVISAIIWGGTEGWNTGDHMAKAAASVGLDLADMESSIDIEETDAVIESNHDALEQAGHWGVPTMVFKGEPFFGQDRVDTLRWRLDKSGLRR